MMEFASNMQHESVIVKHVSSSSSSSLSAADEPEPVSRTYQYRKVMKPLLERKRRARINRCLDDLKDLMVNALQSEGENVSKLEKADILELTVQHLRKTQRQKRLANSSPVIESDRFRAGFKHAANQVSLCLSSIPNVDVELGRNLMVHLAHRLNELDTVQPLTIQTKSTIETGTTTTTSNTPSSQSYSPASSPAPSSCSGDSDSADEHHPHHVAYNMPLTPASSSSRSCHSATPSPSPMEYTSSNGGLLKCASPVTAMDTENVWRPW